MSNAIVTTATDTHTPPAPQPVEQGLVTASGVRLSVAASGSGDPLVLVHGSWDDRQVWALVEQELARVFRVVSYDRRGHADSEDSPRPGTRRDDEDDLAALIETLGLAPANVVANSFGASIALGAAARRPELFRALCAHEPPLLALVADDPLAAEAGRTVASVRRLIERGEVEAAARDFVEHIALGAGGWQSMPGQERDSMVANAHTFAGETLDPAWSAIDLDALGSLTFPVLLTRGGQSPPFFSKIAERLTGAIATVDVRTLPGAGHVPHLTHPGEYVTAITRFLAG